MRYLSHTGTATLLACLTTLATGCSGNIGNEAAPSSSGAGASGTTGTDATVTGTGGAGTVTGTNGATGTTGPSGTTAGTTGGTGGGGGVVTGCVPGIPATSQVPRLTNLAYDNVVRDVLGLRTLSDGTKPSDSLLDDSSGPMDPYMWTAYQTTAAKIATQVMGSELKSNFMACDPATVATCYQDTIAAFGRKMFRRPLTQAEIDSFMRLATVEPAGTPEEISQMILYAFLVSPSFIMVPEVAEGEETPGQQVPLTSHQVAMRLSLALWGSVPDETLSMAADQGQLTTKDQIMAQATRMIQDRDRAGAQIVAAHMKYLNVSDTTHWWQNAPDATKYPEFTAGTMPALQQELDLFFEDVAFNGGTFSDLFLSNVGFVNQDTAAIYGLNPADYGPDLQRVEFPAGERPGFLTRGGFLVSKSHASTTAPILRGAFITIDVLGINPGAPDPNALNTPIPPGDYSTQREVINALTEGVSCRVCHEQFVNPPGFVLERYNAAGVYQETDTSWKPDESAPLGGPVDPSATVYFSDNNVKQVNSPEEMMQAIVMESEPPRLYAQKLVSFVMNRLPNNNDACLVNDLATKLTTVDGYTILNTFSDMAQADSFLARTVGND